MRLAARDRQNFPMQANANWLGLLFASLSLSLSLSLRTAPIV